jgi:DNA-binding beta-propeller fold protein YncE
VKLIYDDERKSIYLIDNDRNRIEAYRFAGITPWAAEPAPFVGSPSASLGGNNVMAFSPDGTEILKTSQDRLWRVDPATGGSFAQNGAVPVAPVVASSASLNFIAFANDGSAIGNTNDVGGGTSLYRYDMLAQKLAALSTDAVMANRDVFASGDGSTLVIATIEPLNLASLKPVITYDASTGAFTTRASITTGDTHVTMDRAASRMILVSSKGTSADQRISVYDHSFNELGKLPAPLQGVVITPDGTKAFAYSAGTGTIRKFDLTSPTVGGFFPEVGGGTPVPDTLGAFFLQMTISADGGSLFLAGNQKVVVMPAP